LQNHVTLKSMHSLYAWMYVEEIICYFIQNWKNFAYFENYDSDLLGWRTRM